MQTEMTIACKEWMKVAKEWRLRGGARIWSKGSKRASRRVSFKRLVFSYRVITVSSRRLRNETV